MSNDEALKFRSNLLALVRIHSDIDDTLNAEAEVEKLFGYTKDYNSPDYVKWPDRSDEYKTIVNPLSNIRDSLIDQEQGYMPGVVGILSTLPHPVLMEIINIVENHLTSDE